MSEKENSPEVLAHVRTADGLAIQLRRDPIGVLEVPQLENVIVGIHLGSPTRLECRRGGRRYTGTAIHGDIDIIPAGTPSRWEIFDENDTALFLSLPKRFLTAIANQSGVDSGQMELLNRFQIKDRELEVLGWAIKRELELGYPSGRLYLEGLGLAVASRLVTQHSSLARQQKRPPEGLSDRRLKQVLTFIEDHLAEDLTLDQIAAVARVSGSHLKAVFGKSLNIPLHQYVIRRRVERAKALLMRSNLSITEIAIATGFAHQSHMARHMRRVLGAPPREIRRTLYDTPPG
jgi:AraC family transcriptional regulator